VDGLVNIGLVDRSIPAENRRMATLQLTDAGNNICQTINNTNDKYFEDTLSVLDEKEAAELIRMLNKVINRMAELRSQGQNSCN
jgi:DNA-binding MarR family transcriptional regulator